MCITENVYVNVRSVSTHILFLGYKIAKFQKPLTEKEMYDILMNSDVYETN